MIQFSILTDGTIIVDRTFRDGSRRVFYLGEGGEDFDQSQGWLSHDEADRIIRLADKLVKKDKYNVWCRIRDVWSGADPIRLERLEEYQSLGIKARRIRPRRSRRVQFHRTN